MSDKLPAIQKPIRAGSIREGLPSVGDWFWIPDSENQYSSEPPSGKPGAPVSLWCVENVASNHIEFKRPEEHGSSTWQIGFPDFYTHCRPALDWREHIDREMQRVRAAMEDKTRQLYDAGIKANAITDEDAKPDPTACMLPAIRVTDPAIQKRKLVALQKRLPLVAKEIDALAKEYTTLAKYTCQSELLKMQVVVGQLGVLQDKIFTLEVYAGLQEEVYQIADGDPARPDEKIAIRQSLLFMDEETLIDYDKGGMDYRKIADFDKWVAQPENIARILPEPRGVVAFRVRRHEKERKATTLWEAWCNMEEALADLETYIVIRNGQRLYRIASEVDFSPRLIPLRTEFDDAFTDKISGWMGKPDTFETTTPQDFNYDSKVKNLICNLRHYNRIVVLIQGLLDRSECFHPHPPINLSNQVALDEWVNLIRDEEDVIHLMPPETFSQYVARINATLRAGDLIWTDFRETKKRTYDQLRRPNALRAERVRKGTKRDICNDWYTRGFKDRDWHEGLSEKECVGVMGVDVSWPWGTRRGYRDKDSWGNGYHGPYGEWPVNKMQRQWIPLTEVFNLDGYKLGDYRAFLCERSFKGAYLEFARQLLTGEDYRLGRLKDAPPRPAEK